MNIYIAILATIGFCISFYSYLLEKKVEQDTAYKPACDISSRISCSKPLLSSYGRLFFGISTALLGMAFYGAIIVFDLCHMPLVVVSIIGMGCIISCYLAYVLFFKVKSLCLLCASIYLINGILLITSLLSLPVI